MLLSYKVQYLKYTPFIALMCWAPVPLISRVSHLNNQNQGLVLSYGTNKYILRQTNELTSQPTNKEGLIPVNFSTMIWGDETYYPFQAGLYEKWEKDITDEAQKEGRTEHRKRQQKENKQQDGEEYDGKNKALTLVHLEGPFLLHLTGLFLAIFTFTAELLASRCGNWQVAAKLSSSLHMQERNWFYMSNTQM